MTLSRVQILLCMVVGAICLSQITACRVSPTQVSVTEGDGPALTEAASSSTVITRHTPELAKVTPSVDARVTAIATPTFPTQRPTVTRRPTLTVTPTPLPTIPPEQIPAILAKLGQNGVDCTLPCWWEMMPGKSRWADHEPFLESIAEISRERRDNPKAIYFVIDANLQQESLSVMNGGVVSVIDGTVDSIVTGGSSDVAQLRLPDFLAINGKPDEVWLNTYSGPYEGAILPFRLYLIYLRGIVAQFELADVPTIGDNVVGCYGQDTSYYTLLYLVSPDQQVSFQQGLSSGTFIDPSQTYLPLEEATSLDIDSFYNEFSRVEHSSCIATPKGIWDN